MPVKLGTIAAIGFDEFPPKQWLACYRRLGCEVVQAYRNQQAKISIAQMKDAIAAGGMPCDSLHGVFGEELDPSAPDDAARRAAVDVFKSEGELALALGGKLVVIHCSTIRHDGISAAERILRVAQLEKSIAELGRFGQSVGVKYAFENLPKYHPVGWDVKELAAILDRVGAPATGMCFDAGHANMVGPVPAAVKDAGDKIIYVHLSDNSGVADEHEMLTCGSMDCDGMARALHEINYSGTMMLEVFYSTDRLKKLIDEGFAARLAKLVALANGK